MPDTCANIGPRERNRRLLLAFIGAAITVAFLVLLDWIDAPRAWRLATFFPLWVGAHGFFQYRERTCTRLAARGQRNLDRGPEAIDDPLELLRVRRQATVVTASAIISAAAIAATLYAIA